MIILIIMAVGILVGLKYFPEKWGKYNHYVQLVSIVLLIFCMGVSLGSNPTFMEQLVSMGFKGVVFAVVPIVGSIGCVYVLSEKFMKNKED